MSTRKGWIHLDGMHLNINPAPRIRQCLEAVVSMITKRLKRSVKFFAYMYNIYISCHLPFIDNRASFTGHASWFAEMLFHSSRYFSRRLMARCRQVFEKIDVIRVVEVSEESLSSQALHVFRKRQHGVRQR